MGKVEQSWQSYMYIKFEKRSASFWKGLHGWLTLTQYRSMVINIPLYSEIEHKPSAAKIPLRYWPYLQLLLYLHAV
jgi:hypothetical protein